MSDTPHISCNAIMMLHRHDDGHIAFQKRHPNGEMEQLFMLTPDEAQRRLPGIDECLVEDSFFSLNAYRRTAPSGWTHKPTGLPAIGKDKTRTRPNRRWGAVTENVKYLNAIFCDLDCGRAPDKAKTKAEQMSAREAQRQVELLQDGGYIPPFTMMGFSGRGINLIWLLKDDLNPSKSPAAHGSRVVAWRRAQKEIIYRMESYGLPVDHNGSLITQQYRVEGGINTKSGKRVSYALTTQFDETQKLMGYTIPEMCKALNLGNMPSALPEQTQDEAKPRIQMRRTLKPGTGSNQARAKMTRLNAMRADDLLRLEQHYQGFRRRNAEYPNGHRTPVYGRRRILDMYARWMIGSMYTPKQITPPDHPLPDKDYAAILVALETMAANMHPAYPEDKGDTPPNKILNAVLKEYIPDKYGKQSISRTPSNEILCKAFGIDDDLAVDLELQTIKPQSLKDRERNERPLQADLIQERREYARQCTEKYGSMTARKLAGMYKAQGYKGANQETANQDLNAIGYNTQRARSGRRRKAPESGN
jgi:hypothetical protein